MKKNKRALSLVMAVLCIGTSVVGVGCNRENGEKINQDQTQLYISNFNAGFGGDWIDDVADKFEQQYAEHSFEDGKKGVQVVVDPTEDTLTITTIKNSRDSLFFTENFDYYDLVSQGALKDITALVNQDVSETEESILEKMAAYSTLDSYYKTSDDKYYAVPFHEGFTGMIYDVDLFESKSLYFSKGYDDGVTGAARWVGATGDRSHGPDGEYGTFDDGMPATYSDFYVLLDRMKEKGVTPMTWAGKFPAYTSKAFLHLWATNEGVDQMMLNFTLNGEATDLATINNDGSVALSTETITADNAWKLQQQYGKYQVLEFVSTLANDSTNYHTLANSGSETHKSAQSTYLYSTMKNEPIGILFDGTWWQREANAVFQAMESVNSKYSKQNRRFAIMPIPHATEENVGKDQIYLGGLNSCVFMSSYITDKGHVAAAEAFLKFVHTEESLKQFTRATGATRPFEYDFTDEELLALPYYTQSSWNIHKNETIIDPKSNSSLLINNYEKFNLDFHGFEASISGVSYPDPIVALKTHSVKDYFKGMVTYKQGVWETLKK